MSATPSTVFRPTALRRYIDDRERAVLPRFVSARAFLVLWLLLGLLAGAAFTAWLARVPVYAAGPAIVVEQPAVHSAASAGVVFVLLLPPEVHDRLHTGQSVLLNLDGTRLRRPILAIEPEISSPNAARRRFGLDVDLTGAVNRPVAVAVVDPAPLPSGLPASAYAGTLTQAEVEIGTRRALSFVPLIGRLFGG